MSFQLSTELLFSLRSSQKGSPMQGILLGTRRLTPHGQVHLIASRFVPVEHISQLCHFIREYISLDDEFTIVGWCLLLDREAPLAKLAAAYFDCFHRACLRSLLASLPETPFDKELQTEIIDFIAPLKGLIVVRELVPDHLTREYCAYDCVMNEERLLHLMDENPLSSSEFNLNETTFSLDSYPPSVFLPNLDGISNAVCEEILLSTFETCAPDGGSKEDLAAGYRKMRRRKLSKDSTRDASVVVEGGKHRPPIASRTNVEIIPSVSDSSLENIIHSPSNSTINNNTFPSITQSIDEKCKYLRDLHSNSLSSLESYIDSCRKHELLSLVYKVLCQPDEVLVKKLASLEEDEDGLRRSIIDLPYVKSPSQ